MTHADHANSLTTLMQQTESHCALQSATCRTYSSIKFVVRPCSLLAIQQSSVTAGQAGHFSSLSAIAVAALVVHGQHDCRNKQVMTVVLWRMERLTIHGELEQHLPWWAGEQAPGANRRVSCPIPGWLNLDLVDDLAVHLR